MKNKISVTYFLFKYTLPNVSRMYQYIVKAEIFDWKRRIFSKNIRHYSSMHTRVPAHIEVSPTAEHTGSPYCCWSRHGSSPLLFSFFFPLSCSAAGSPPSLYSQSQESWGRIPNTSWLNITSTPVLSTFRQQVRLTGKIQVHLKQFLTSRSAMELFFLSFTTFL